MSSLRDWALGLPAQGRFTFTTTEVRAVQDRVSVAGTAAALDRAEADRIIVSPVRSFHVVLPLEDRGTGTPSWRLFLDPLMAHLQMPYYVGLLTAASIHGATPQAAQIVQVVTPRPRRPIHAGRLAIEFVVRRRAAQAPVELVTTPSGRMRVATPEMVGFDLVRYPARAGGWDNVLYRAAGPGSGDATIRHEGGTRRGACDAGSPAPGAPPGPGWRGRRRGRPRRRASGAAARLGAPRTR